MATDEKDSKKAEIAVGTAGAAAASGAVLAGTKMPEHSHFTRKTRKYIRSLPAGVHEVDTKLLTKRPRKLGARKQQAPYVATMARERPTPYAPVPITRYKDGVIQRDSAHSVMANAMKSRKTLINVEDAPGYRPTRRTGEELVRRAQGRYQQVRLKRYTGISEKKIAQVAGKYKDSSRKANTAKRPHGVVEEGYKMSKKPYTMARALRIAKAEQRRRDTAAGAAAAGGAGALALTPVRRSAPKVTVTDGRISSKDAKKLANPGLRPGNKGAIKRMGANLGGLENKPSTVISYKDGRAVTYDGNHRMTARVARGDKSVPVKVVEGGERPAVSVTRNAYHVSRQKLHRSRIERGVFKPEGGKHRAPSRAYRAFADASPSRSGRKLVAIESTRAASGPTKLALRGKQAVAVGTGAALLGTAAHLNKDEVKKRDYTRAQDAWERRAMRANRVENTGQTVAGAAGLTLGAGALREAAFRDYPDFKARMEARAAKLPKKVATPLVQGKPGFKVLATAAGGTLVAAGGTRSKKIAEKQAEKYRRMNEGVAKNKGAVQNLRLAKPRVVQIKGGGTGAGKKAQETTEHGARVASQARQQTRSLEHSRKQSSVRTPAGVYRAQRVGGKVETYETDPMMNYGLWSVGKSLAEPGGLMHAADIAKLYTEERLASPERVAAGRDSEVRQAKAKMPRRKVLHPIKTVKTKNRVRSLERTYSRKGPWTEYRTDEMTSSGVMPGAPGSIGMPSRILKPGEKGELLKAESMSNAELARRKKVQSTTSIAGSTLGLAALGSLGAAKLLPKATKLGKTPRGQAYARHLDRTATQLAIGASGVGGVGGYNFAEIQRAEARKVTQPKTP